MSSSLLPTLALSRYEIDRDHAYRLTPNLFESLWADESTRVLPLHDGQALLSAGQAGASDWGDVLPRGEGGSASEHPVLAFVPAALVPDVELQLYLGLSLATDAAEPVGTRLVAVTLSDEAALALDPDKTHWVNLRNVAVELSDRDAGAYTEALGVLNWHRSHTHCPRCGAETVPEAGGWVRRCPVQDIEIFPRTDPAVIVGIVDQHDRILLGSNALWEANRYSLLAGFVEPGESLEAAAIREVFEESGVRILEPQYLGSQPWPFPASLMCGFLARVDPATSGDALLPDGEEIMDVRWFSREDLADPEQSVLLPGSASIARAILEHWYGGPIPSRSR
ncbi:MULTISPECIES: NAD(+) diphosphatase [Subtercola]|uniref:NAD(+) diphosphatase n=1 Tax=Subtercola vilae TaxID=2056433 RepID=A0A4T2C3B0_9MICO|nr:MULTISPECIES: NAD(+) diphosphatase [Subtercola]MEA9985903.1 NAD(+) diphosphatase [Subtercola sp. RTI3]TIH36906.1 NAD(+) diphosphatase [Subtercola vilae]